LALKLIVMTKFKASDNNQRLAYWFKMQTKQQCSNNQLLFNK
jgi:hypothetical protein